MDLGWVAVRAVGMERGGDTGAVYRRLSAAVAIVALAAACSTGDTVTSPDRDVDVVVGSFDFAESRLLGEIYAQALEQEGVVVGRELGLGPRELVLPALREGLLDVVPEYAGAALEATGRPVTSHADVVAGLRAAMEDGDLRVLEASAASNENVVVVTPALSAREGVRTIDDLGPLDRDLVLGGPAECRQRPRCLRGLRATYGLEFAGFVPFQDADQVARALADGVVDVGVLFSTDSVLADGGLVVLGDPRGLHLPDPVVPLVRAAVAGDRRVQQALDRVSAALTTQALRFLNWRISQPESSVEAEARGWLVRHGLADR